MSTIAYTSKQFKLQKIEQIIASIIQFVLLFSNNKNPVKCMIWYNAVLGKDPDY